PKEKATPRRRAAGFLAAASPAVLAGSRPPDNSAIPGLEQFGFPLLPAPLLGAVEGPQFKARPSWPPSSKIKSKSSACGGVGGSHERAQAVPVSRRAAGDAADGAGGDTRAGIWRDRGGFRRGECGSAVGALPGLRQS